MFEVTETDRRVARDFEEGPQYMCHRGDEDCAFSPRGACTLVPCTCEVSGYCLSCRPVNNLRRIP